MSVRFKEIVFKNDNGIDVQLTVEAPVGKTVVQQHVVGPGATYQLQPGVDDCTDVLLIAKAAHHDPDRQQFTVAGSLTRAFLQHVTAHYLIGSIQGSVAGRTERG